MNQAVLKKIQIARTQLLLDSPFFGVCALQLKLTETPANEWPYCPTAWTDGTHMGYNPDFIEKLTPNQLIGLIAHEVMHCACGHPWRRDSREPILWNFAADYAINDLLLKAGIELPQGCLHDKQYEGKWAEWIYDRLPQELKDKIAQMKAAGQGSGFGDVRDAPGSGKDGDEQAQTEEGWKQLAQQAAQAAKAQGKLPDNLKRMLGELLEPKVDWKSVLRRFIQQVVSSDYSWHMPNKRYINQGLYLPRLHSEACGRIVIAVDTSGSIDGIVLNKFAAEMRAIAQDVQPSSIDVMYCDAAVHRTDVFERGEMLELHPCGGGGTDFRPVFTELKKQEPPVCMIYLTDLYGTFPESAPEYPVIWATISNLKEVPFGELVEIND